MLYSFLARDIHRAPASFAARSPESRPVMDSRMDGCLASSALSAVVGNARQRVGSAAAALAVVKASCRKLISPTAAPGFKSAMDAPSRVTVSYTHLTLPTSDLV